MEGLDAMKISEEKKKYIVELLNPMLEEMVAECIHKMPADPVPFMLDWLERKKISDEEKDLTPEEKQRLKEENKKLQESMTKVKSEMQEAAKMVTAKDEDESEEEDDADEEPPPDFFRDQTQTKARASVSAEAYGDWNKKKAFVAPVVAKTDEQKDRLKMCLAKSFLFSTLEDQDLIIVIGAMKEVIAQEKERVINQGDQGDFLFVIESGKLDCIIKLPDASEKVVKTCEAGDVFGELALLYNCPRAASVEASEKCVLWQLDRDTFNNIVKEAAQKKRQRYDAFLAKVPILASMDAYERSQLADALKVENFGDGSTICKQGENGNKFYIIEEGAAVAMKGDQQVMAYNAGDYFGELALIRNQPRAATVMTKGQTKLLSIDSRSFKRLLNVQELLERTSKYE
jgi:cAMP-dependent protein kinase regulator|mmetsp:Transcript_49235/g.77863  ORF Transcript_49235/g.77863 Transcript_49235/m.77863 type:complete len:401 (+) Transcript_49235:68-1270(+)